MDRITGFGPVDGGSNPSEPIFQMKRKLTRHKKRVLKEMNRFERNLYIIVISVLILVLVVIWIKSTYFPAEEFDEEVINFCSKQCGEKDVVFSKNHTDKGFIECECIEEITPGYSRIGTPHFETKTYYYNSSTLEEIIS